MLISKYFEDEKKIAKRSNNCKTNCGVEIVKKRWHAFEALVVASLVALVALAIALVALGVAPFVSFVSFVAWQVEPGNKAGQPTRNTRI